MVDGKHPGTIEEPGLPAAAGGLSAEDQADLLRAVAALEGSSFAARLGALIGRQIGTMGELIPKRVSEVANKAAAKALDYAMRGALKTLGGDRQPAATSFHLAAVAASGALGGAFGFASLPVELPVSTTLILRAVADIARDEGEDLSRPEAGLACLEVFALGTERGTEAAPLGESGYFAVRALLARSVSEAARFMLQRGLGEEAAPVLLRLVGQVASRFGLVVSQKILAQTVPLLGAVTGAVVNAAFMDHYQTLARGHFIVRRLERRYGADVVHEAYEAIRAARDAETAGAAEPRVPATFDARRERGFAPEQAQLRSQGDR